MEKIKWFFVTNIGRTALAAIIILFSGILYNFYDWPLYPLLAGGLYFAGFFLVGMFYAVRSLFRGD